MRRAATAVLTSVVLVVAASACGGGHPHARSDDRALLNTAVGFLQKVRENSDPTLYVKAKGLLDGLGRRHPDDPEVLDARGTLALAQHRFSDALAIGDRALRAAPGSATAYGILVDADNELGRYDDALRATQNMVDAKPSLSAYARVSYARELRGDYAGAIDAMQQAIDAAGTDHGENVAYVETLLGQLQLTTKDLEGAEASFAAADRSFPGFIAAKAGRAQLLVARGEYAQAAALLGDIVKAQPLPQYAAAWGDALTAAGRPADAAHAYEIVDVISKLFASNGVRLDLEIALFDADHHPGAAAVDRARRALRERPSTLAHDVLAWNLFQTGRFADAAAESAKALALGSRDPLEQYHAAEIAEARGDHAGAAAHLRIVLSENSRFNARLVPRIAQLARTLGL